MLVAKCKVAEQHAKAIALCIFIVIHQLVVNNALDLPGAAVSIDAMGCRQVVAQTILDGGADYAPILKDDHPILRQDVQIRLDTYTFILLI
ncbi:MAG: hypothetical protein P9E24_04970 [Candidatus Competibacter sp.]|nr:hypothetical protein [Candidatus Competibacter sp.]MDG4585665.1 hypothetical protein [Candidatus Competibacter sp.]